MGSGAIYDLSVPYIFIPVPVRDGVLRYIGYATRSAAAQVEANLFSIFRQCALKDVIVERAQQTQSTRLLDVKVKKHFSLEM